MTLKSRAISILIPGYPHTPEQPICGLWPSSRRHHAEVRLAEHGQLGKSTGPPAPPAPDDPERNSAAASKVNQVGNG